MIDLSSKEGLWSFDAARTAIAVALRATATARARRNAAEGQASCLVFGLLGLFREGNSPRPADRLPESRQRGQVGAWTN